MKVYKLTLRDLLYEKEFILFQSELQLYLHKLVIEQPKYLPIDLHNFYICFPTNDSYMAFIFWKDKSEFKNLTGNHAEFKNI